MLRSYADVAIQLIFAESVIARTEAVRFAADAFALYQLVTIKIEHNQIDVTLRVGPTTDPEGAAAYAIGRLHQACAAKGWAADTVSLTLRSITAMRDL